VSSVRDRNFLEQTKDTGHVYTLPTFSEKETNVFATVRSRFVHYPPKEEILRRFEEVGGCPRFLLHEEIKYQDVLKKQTLAVNSLDNPKEREEFLQTTRGESAPRYVLHYGVLPNNQPDINSTLMKYRVGAATIASGLVCRLLAIHRGRQVELLADVLTNIDSPGRPYFFELRVIHFVQDGFTLPLADRAIPIPWTHATVATKDDVERDGYILWPEYSYIPAERNFPVVDDWSIYCLVQVTRAKRHVLDWTNATFNEVLSKVLDARDRERMEENVPFLFIVPEGRTTVPVEKGQPHPRVDVYVVVVSDLPHWIRNAFEGELEEASQVVENIGTKTKITIANTTAHPNRERCVISVSWMEVARPTRWSERLQLKNDGDRSA
jgi:hypothetical protein